jgi:hypothetical protein
VSIALHALTRDWMELHVVKRPSLGHPFLARAALANELRAYMEDGGARRSISLQKASA